MAHLYKRGKRYHLKYYVNGRQKDKALGTDSYQMALELKRQFESGLANGVAVPLPKRTPLPGVLEAYVQHVRTVKTAKSAQSDIYYLRETFGPICEGLVITSRRVSAHPRKASKAGARKADKRRKPMVIEACHLEAITTQQIAAFIDSKVREHRIAPKRRTTTAPSCGG